MAGNQVSKTVAIDYFQQAVLGYDATTLTTYADGSTAPQVASGSIVEISQELYEFPSNETITGWSGISNSTQAYIKFVPSGATCTVVFTSSAPTWSDAKHGWYSSNDRYVYAVYKDVSGNYQDISWIIKKEIHKQYNEAFFIDVVNASKVNTGQGDNELYAMDQDVETGDDVAFNSTTTSLNPFISTRSLTLTAGTGIGTLVPQGMYLIGTTGVSGTSIDVLTALPSTWTGYGNLTAGQVLISDGTSVRIKNGGGPVAVQATKF